MSAIGGMIRWETKSFDSRPLFEMSRAMRLRGGAMRCADLRKHRFADDALFNLLIDPFIEPVKRKFLTAGNHKNHRFLLIH